MSRLYLDWNVISNLRESKQERFLKLQQLLCENRDAFLTPFSNYHVEDILHNNKTEDKIEQFVRNDLKYLGELSQEQYLGLHDGEIHVKVGSPLAFLDNIDFTSIKELLNFGDGLKRLNVEYGDNRKINAGTILDSLFKRAPVPVEMGVIKANTNRLTDMMYPNINSYGSFNDMIVDFGNFMTRFMTERDFYKDFRNALKEFGLKLDVNQGNWTAEEVMPKMNEMLASLGGHLSFERLMELNLQKEEDQSRDDLKFVFAYLFLDLFGYQSDSLKKKSNDFLNIQHDGMHGFLGAFCDIVVSEDEKFIKKCNALYSYFQISTRAYTTDEALVVISSALCKKEKEIVGFVNGLIAVLNNENIVHDEKLDEEQKEKFTIYKLPFYLFNYFNYAIVSPLYDKNILQLRFRRVFKNKSRFIYYLETKNLLKEVFALLGDSYEGQNIKDVEAQFVYEESKDVSVSWLKAGVGFALEKDIDNSREDFLIFIPYDYSFERD